MSDMFDSDSNPPAPQLISVTMYSTSDYIQSVPLTHAVEHNVQSSSDFFAIWCEWPLYKCRRSDCIIVNAIDVSVASSTTLIS